MIQELAHVLSVPSFHSHADHHIVEGVSLTDSFDLLALVDVYQSMSINVHQEVLVRTTKNMVNRIAISKARVNLGAVVKRAHLNGEYFILEKDGIPIAGIMDADELEDYLELRDPKVKKQIAASRADAEAGRVRPARDLVSELKGQVRKTAARKRA
jgi:hypothetical protein